MMFQRKSWQNWKRRKPNHRSPNPHQVRRVRRNERAFSTRTGPRGRVFRNKSLQRFILAARGRRCGSALALSDWRRHLASAIQLLLAVRLLLFFHPFLLLVVFGRFSLTLPSR